MSKQSVLMERGKATLMNTYARAPICIERGEGCRLWDVDGKEYLDFVAGIAVCNLGHAHPKITEAICDQAKKLVHISNLYWQEPNIRLGELLCKASRLDKVFFANSGAEANEAALKLARKWGGDRRHIISLEKSFHGRTMGALKATGQTHYQESFLPLPEGFSKVPANDFEALEAAVQADSCAVLLEIIQGEGGIIALEKDYLMRVQDLCREKNILLMIDEVQTGIGRCGHAFAFQAYDLEPDVISLAKGLANGFPIGAILAKEEVARAFKPGDHASTFGGNPVASRAGEVVCETIFDEDFLQEVRAKGEFFRQGLESLVKNYPDHFTEIRGRGLMLGLVCQGEAAAYLKPLRDQGFLVGSAGSNVLRFVPPLIVEREDIRFLLDTIEGLVQV